MTGPPYRSISRVGNKRPLPSSNPPSKRSKTTRNPPPKLCFNRHPNRHLDACWLPSRPGGKHHITKNSCTKHSSNNSNKYTSNIVTPSRTTQRHQQRQREMHATIRAHATLLRLLCSQWVNHSMPDPKKNDFEKAHKSTFNRGE